MADFRLTPEAKSDLIKIRHFTKQNWGSKQSKKYISELRQTMLLLADNPSLGKARPEVGLDVFSFPYPSHVIYYMVHKQQLVVFGVLHKSMIPLKHLSGRDLKG